MRCVYNPCFQSVSTTVADCGGLTWIAVDYRIGEKRRDLAMLRRKTSIIACLRNPQHGSIPGASTNQNAMRDTPARIKQFVAGHCAAAAKLRELLAADGPNPDQAVAECLSALAALESSGQGLNPGTR